MTELDFKRILNKRGILKLVQTLANFLCIISYPLFVAYAPITSDIRFFEFVVCTGFILDLVFLAMKIGKFFRLKYLF